MKTMKKESGFTLFELLVVISIIGIVIALGTTSYSSAQKRARDARRRQDIGQVHQALEQYYGANSYTYPAGCAVGPEFLPGGLPTDPKNVSPYTYEWSCDSTNGRYCICARLEVTSSGNADNLPTNGVCDYGTGNYYCLQNVE